MFGKFLSAMGKQKLKEASENITSAIVKFDPESATEASIQMMDEHVSKLSLEAAKLRQEFNKEEAEAVAVQESYNQRLAAAEHIQEQLTGDVSAKKRKDLEGSLNTLVGSLEGMAADVQRETDEANDAAEVLSEVEATLQLAVNKLKTARNDHKDAQRALKKAELSKQRAQAAEGRAKELAGITSQTDGLSVALNAMKEAAADQAAEADAARTKAALLTPEKAEDDSNISAALAAVSGDVEESSSPVDRLAALKRF